jgi:sugar phosphate isomerase/epimerase
VGDGMGVAVDVYHVWWDPQVEQQIARAGKRIAAFHTCDWLTPTTDLVFDRGIPGDGVIDIARLRGLAQDAGFDGLLEMEILSKRWWAHDPDDMLRLCKERHENAC